MSASCTDMYFFKVHEFIRSYLIRSDFWGSIHVGKEGLSTSIIFQAISCTIDTFDQPLAVSWCWTPRPLKDVARGFVEAGRDRTEPIAVTYTLLNYIFTPIRPPAVLLARELSG